MKDFKDFLNPQENSSRFNSQGIFAKLDEKIEQTLNPRPFLIFLQILGIHLLSSLVTLSLCPQFGFRLFGEGHGLMHYFMWAGTTWCFALCGGFYLSSTVLLSWILFSKYQWRVFTKNSGLMLSGLVMVSLGFFLMVNAELVFNITLVWAFGALAATWLPIKMALYRRKYA